MNASDFFEKRHRSTIFKNNYTPFMHGVSLKKKQTTLNFFTHSAHFIKQKPEGIIYNISARAKKSPF